MWRSDHRVTPSSTRVRWGTATDVDAARNLQTVACASTTFCAAAGAGGYGTTYNGSTWSSAFVIDGTRTVQSVACPSASVCAAVDSQGYETTYNGSTWSTATDIDVGQALQGLSCASTSFCEASDTAGNVVNFNGTAWYVVQNVDAARSVGAISCPSATFCAAVDGSGYAVTYQPQATFTSAQLTWNTNNSLPLVVSDGANDYIYGPSGTPVEQVSVATSTPTYMTYTAADDTWLTTNAAGDETGLWGYDAFGNLAYGNPMSPFGYGGQYADATTGLVNDRARWFEPQTGGFTTRDPTFAQTNQSYAYAGGDPVNQFDPTGLYHYRFSWYLGLTSRLGAADNAFLYFLLHPHQIFPFNTQNCDYFYQGEDCHFDVHGTADHLYVSTLSGYSMTLKVENWCFTPGILGSCALGDPPGSTITFSVGTGHVSAPQQGIGCGDFLYLRQEGNSPNAGPVTNKTATLGAFGDWHQQAVNLIHALGGTRDALLITNPGWSFGYPASGFSVRNAI